MSRRAPSLALAAALLLALVPNVPASAATTGTSFTRWTSSTDFAKGTSSGISAISGALTIGKGTSKLTNNDPYAPTGTATYDTGTWTSPWQSTGYSARTLVPSWNITGITDTWARIEVRVKSGSTTGSWDTVADWGYGVTSVHRTSPTSQTDDLAKVNVDTVTANAGKTFSSWQIRVVLAKPKGATAKPTLMAVGATVASYATRSQATSRTTMTRSTVLAVPQYSQMIHKGQYAEYGGGGEAWCSPTSTVMVLRYFTSGPSTTSTAFAKKYADPFVDHAARYTYDYRYKGTGNWPFNTAYAGTYGLDAFVTRFTDLRDAEAFIKAGIPVVASVAFGRGQLTGAPISSTPGHLMVIVGFTAAGNVIVNDPAGSSNSRVRLTYNRAQFEKAWLGGSGGIVYVIHPTSKPLPKATTRW